MLSDIHIRNFAIIDAVEVEFAPGMNVLTGETGAGKSILIDALGLALGERASSSVVRDGSKRADISATFDLSQMPQAQAWLNDQSLDADSDCVLRRVIGADGRSKAFINGSPVAAQSLRELGQLLVRIHGQHQHQHLMVSTNQRNLLDARGKLAPLCDDVAQRHAAWRDATTALDSLREAQAQREERLEILNFNIEALNAVNPAPGEYEQLISERDRLANSGQLMELTSDAIDALYERDGANAQSLLADTMRLVERVTVLDVTASDTTTLLREAEASISEAADSLRRYRDQLEADPARHEYVEQRVADIERLARRHQVEASTLPSVVDTLQSEYELLLDADQKETKLQVAVDHANEQLQTAADALSEARKASAEQLAEEITASMQTLGMAGGVFEIHVERHDSPNPGVHGQDRVTYRVSANPGQAPQPLARVASGGELSRISLAIQVAAGREDGVACMIFDEVDSGVGGAIAEKVGVRMRELATSCQVLAVTHLAQVAGQAHHHMKVAKITDGKSTRTRISALAEDSRIEEVARMLTGIEITATSRDHARELIADRPAASRRTAD
ncbi:MAG: DNA repair protein RecN [Pseudomonadota bacterium]